MRRKTSPQRFLSLAAASITFGVCWAAESESVCDHSALTDALGVGKGIPIWGGLQSFRSELSTCGEGSSSRTYWAYLAQLESYVGNHSLAHSYFAKLARSDRSRKHASLPADVRAVRAAAYIAHRAQDHRIVIVNERHHVTSDRLLTMDLLEPLAALGFRYLALETASGEDPTNERGYPVRGSGYYTNDVVFAEVVRSAIEHGFEIVAYEIEGDQWQGDKDRGVTASYAIRREYWQGRNIADRVIRGNPDAKVLVHCGWGHVRESGSSMMAQVLSEMTGLDPLTVDQAMFADRGHVDVNPSLWTAADERNLTGDEEVVLLDDDGDLIPIGDPSYVDVHVLGRRTRYENGRPTWMEMDGRRQPVKFPTPECENRACIVEARSAWHPDAVAFDRVEVDGDPTATLYVPREGASGDVYGLDGSLIAQRDIVVTAKHSEAGQGEG